MSQASESKREFLSIPEAAAVYGGSEAFWRKQVFYRRIQFFKRGRCVVFRRADIEEYFASRRVAAIGQEAA